MTVYRVKFLKQRLKQQLKEYFQNSTLHGVHYAADGRLHVLERLTWIIFCCISMVSTALIITLLWEKFQTNPTITGLDTNFHDWNVPFPAITLCVSHPHDENRTKDFVRSTSLPHSFKIFEEKYCKTQGLNDDELRNGTQEQEDCFSQVLTKLAGISYGNIESFKEYMDAGVIFSGNLRSISMKVYSLCEDIFKDCTWKSRNIDSCCFPNNPDGLRPIFTDHGFCYTFNSLKTENYWPWLSGVGRREVPLEIYETDDSWDYSFNVRDAKYFPVKVFIHDAMEIPAAEFQPQHEWDGRISQLVFSAKTTYTTDGARQLSISQRHCVFPDEIHLDLDPEGYTYGGCLRQCHADEAMRLCSCVPPFVDEIGNYKHCDLNGLTCLSSHKASLINCESSTCELSCLNTVYEVEKLTGGFCKQNECEPLHVGFISWPMVRYKREVLFGWIDLFVSFGGIAGLFLGFSLLSGVEIIYYLAIRALCLVFSPSKLEKKSYTKNEKVQKLKSTKKPTIVSKRWKSFKQC